MKILKRRLMSAAAKKLRDKVDAIKNWIKELTAIKVTAIIVVNCFLLTGVYGQSVSAVISDIKSGQEFKQIFSDFMLPYTYGKITSSNYAGSDTVIINIQDLHSHPGVQRNISSIIDSFDKEYGVKRVYLEGGYGPIDTSWINAIGKDIRQKAVDAMIDAG
ncbi:MAG: hypothetical protein LBQ47_06975, partial [Endomicrobium sp.]|nr:hypothetical protein [Endomicrobium sp.]